MKLLSEFGLVAVIVAESEDGRVYHYINGANSVGDILDNGMFTCVQDWIEEFKSRKKML